MLKQFFVDSDLLLSIVEYLGNLRFDFLGYDFKYCCIFGQFEV